MANPLTAGTFQIVSQGQISGAQIAPQGTAVSNDFSPPTAGAVASTQLSLAYGTGSGQADILCAGEYDLTVSGGGTPSVTIDLFANGLPNVFGGTANFLHLKAIHVSIKSGGDSSGVKIGNAGANPNKLYFDSATDTWTILPNGTPFVGGDPATGVVVDSTHRNILIANASAVAVVTVRVMLAGTSV